MKKFKIWFYQTRLRYLLSAIDFNSFIDILEKYNKFKEPNEGQITGEDVLAFKTDNTYDVFFENLHLHCTRSENEKVITLNLKRNDGFWNVNKSNISSPLNESFEIYCWYDILVMNKTRCFNSEYISGTWNKYVFTTFRKFVNTVNGFTIECVFKNEYK